MDTAQHPVWCDPEQCTAGITFRPDGSQAPMGGHRSARMPLIGTVWNSEQWPLPRTPVMWLSHTLSPDTDVVMKFGPDDSEGETFTVPIRPYTDDPSQILAAVFAGDFTVFNRRTTTPAAPADPGH
jgi:hypothetical protein